MARVQAGIEEPAVAVFYARQVPGIVQRTNTLVQIGVLLRKRGEESSAREVLAEALELARQLSGKNRSRALAMLIPHLPPNQRQNVLGEALSLVHELDNYYDKARALISLLPYRPTSQRERLVQHVSDLIEGLGNPYRRSRALAALIPYLPTDQQPSAVEDAIETAAKIPDAARSLYTRAVLIQHLPLDRRRSAVAEVLRAIQDLEEDPGNNRHIHYAQRYSLHALAAVAPFLSPDLLEEAIITARRLRRAHRRAYVLAELARHLPLDRSCRLLDEAWAGVRGTRDRSGDVQSRAYVLASLVPYLPRNEQGDVLPDVLSLLDGIRQPYQRARVLTVVAPYLPLDLRESELQTVLAMADKISDKELRAYTLMMITPHLPDGQRRAVQRDALAIARTIRHIPYRAYCLVALAPQLPPELLSEALTSALRIRDRLYCVYTLAALEPRLDGEQRLAVLTDIRDREGEEPHLSTMHAVLSPDTPPDMRKVTLLAALSQAQTVEDVPCRILALYSLAPHLPNEMLPSVLNEALVWVRGTRQRDRRARMFSMFVPIWSSLPTHQAYALWSATLRLRTLRSRPGFLTDLGALSPIIFRLGGARAVVETVRAVKDVTRYMP